MLSQSVLRLLVFTAQNMCLESEQELKCFFSNMLITFEIKQLAWNPLNIADKSIKRSSHWTGLMHTFIIFQMFHLSYIWLMLFEIVFPISITGVKVRNSSQPVASKNYSLCPIAWWLFICYCSLQSCPSTAMKVGTIRGYV